MNKMDKVARELNALKAQVGNMNSPQLAFSSIEDGAINEYNADGSLASIIGAQHDGTHGVTVVNGPIPPVPTTPTVTGGSGVIRVNWNGTFDNDNVAPMDFARVEVHISDTAGFAFDPMPNSATRAGSIETAGGGEVALIRIAGTYYVKLISRAQTGKYSAPSGEVSVIVDPVVSQQELDGILTEVQAANTDLANLQVTLGTVQTDLDAAQATLDTVDEIDGRLDTLEIDYTAMETSVANATSAANNALTEAQASSSVANAATSAATAAQTAAENAAAEAGAATQAAQEAEAQALAAANLVADKSTVYYGSTAPAGDPQGLWIKDGKPYLWDGTNWVVSNDPELTQAVADAAQAQTDAANALAQATQAATDAAAATAAAAQAATDAAGAQTAAQNALSAANSAQTAANAAAVSAGDATDASAAASAAAGAAQLAATNAETVATQAEAAAVEAVADADAALVAAQNAVTVGNNAVTTANAATGTANTALQEAADAAEDAVLAITTSNAATTAAQAAQDTADQAEADALAAAGLAGSKGKVIYQATAPTGANAVSTNLWIRTSDNKPHTYDGTQWVAVTDKVATDAASAASSANSLAQTAWNLANTANTQANTATNLANTAQTAADTAQAAAVAAQGAADDASDAALDAAGLAGSKGKVIYSATEPTGADKVVQNLWIRTTDNKPHTLVNGVWTAITDKAATDAAAAAASAQTTANTATTAAATAQSRADTAWNLANTANGTANTALSTANGKNKVTYSLNAPGTAANTAGDIWFRKDASNVIIGQWEGMGGTTWTAKTIGNTVIANLDAGKITSGYINAARIDAGTITIGQIKPGDVATPTQVTAAQNAAIATAAADATAKADAAALAAEQAAQDYADGEISASELATLQAAATDAQTKATAAQEAAITAAAADATAKANAAQTAAITAAATDAQTKANAAKAAAEAAAKAYADGEIDAQALLTAQQAAADAQTKADAAQAAAIAAAAADATTKANNAKTAAEAAAKTYADGAIASRTNLIDNPSRTGVLGRWNGTGLSVQTRIMNAVSQPVLELASTGADTIAYSATTGTTGQFQIDPTKAYQISVWLEDEKALAAAGTNGTTQIYLGIHVYQSNGSTSSNVVPVTTAGVSGGASSNFYFMNATATTAPINGFRRYVGYLMPMGTDPLNMKGLGVNVLSNAILGSDARWGRIRVLNYNNQNTAGGRKVWIAHPTVVEVDSLALEAAAKAAATADAASSTITLWKYPGQTLIDGGKIYTDSITANQIAASAITASEIAANAVTSDKVLANAIIAGKIAANAVTATTIAADAVTAGKIAADAITAREIAANAVTASEINAGAVVAGKIAAGAVTAGTIAADAVAAGTVAANVITGREVNALAINTGHLVAGAVVADKIAAGAVVADKLAANSVTAAKIVGLTITGDKIAANAISTDKLIANAVTSDKVTALAITSEKIAALAITADKIAANAITAEKIQAGQIDVGHLAAGTLSANNIEAGNLQATIGIGSAGSIIAGEVAGAATEITDTGLQVHIVDQEEGSPTVGQRLPNPMIDLGSHGEQALAITNGVSPTPVSSLSASGAISGIDLSTANDPEFAGQLLMGAWSNRDTTGAGSQDSILWNMPWGLIGEVVDVGMKAGSVIVPSGVNQFLAWNSWSLYAGRMYRVNFGPYRISATNFTSTTTSDAIVRMYSSWVPLGSTPTAVADSASNQIIFRREITQGETSVGGHMSTLIRPGSSVEQSFAVSLSGSGCDVQLTGELESNNLMWIEDVGPWRAWTGGTAYGSSTAPVQKKTYYFYPTSTQIKQLNFDSTFSYNGQSQQSAGNLVQGRWSTSDTGSYRGFMNFQNAVSASGSSATGVTFANALLGASRVEAKLRTTMAWSPRSSVTPKIGWATSETVSSNTSPGSSVTGTAVSAGGTTTTALGTTGSSYLLTNRTNSGLRLFVGPGSSTSNVDFGIFYGTGGSSSQDARLQVDVWK